LTGDTIEKKQTEQGKKSEITRKVERKPLISLEKINIDDGMH